jgi:hypothetical protein
VASEKSKTKMAIRVTNSCWGSIETQNGAERKQHKDCRIWSIGNHAGSSEWDWATHGTRHVPGIQFRDFEDLLLQYPDTEVVILSSGMDNKLQVHPELQLHLRQFNETHGTRVATCVMGTLKAIEFFNQFSGRHKAIALLPTPRVRAVDAPPV